MALKWEIHVHTRFYERSARSPRSTKKSAKLHRIVDSASNDYIYMVNGGRIKTQKQLMLGLYVRSLSGSKQLLRVLNNFGHTVSYSVLEEIETAAAYTAISKSSIIPPSIKTDKNSLRITRACFDNYDLKF